MSETAPATGLRTERLEAGSDSSFVVVLTLDRPTAMNAIDNAMLAALHAALDEVEGDADVRGVVLAGGGRSRLLLRDGPQGAGRASATTICGRSGR